MLGVGGDSYFDSAFSFFLLATHVDSAAFKLTEDADSAAFIHALKADKSNGLPGRAGDSNRGDLTIRMTCFCSRSCRALRALLLMSCTVSVCITIELSIAERYRLYNANVQNLPHFRRVCRGRQRLGGRPIAADQVTGFKRFEDPLPEKKLGVAFPGIVALIVQEGDVLHSSEQAPGFTGGVLRAKLGEYGNGVHLFLRVEMEEGLIDIG